MRMRLLLGEKILLGFTMSLLILLGITGLAQWQLRKVTETNNWVLHTQEVRTVLPTLLSQLQDIESSQRGYLLTAKEQYLEPFDPAQTEIEKIVVHLRQLTADNPQQQRTLDRLLPLVSQRVSFAKEVIATQQEFGQAAALSLMETDTGLQLMNNIRDLMHSMQKEERELLQQRTTTATQQTVQTMWLIGLGSASALLLVAFAGLAIRRDLGRRQSAEAELRQLHASLERQVHERTSDLSQVNTILATTNVSLQQEITERQRSERERTRLAAYNHLLLESIGEGIYTVDPHGLCTYLNQQGAAMLATSPMSLTNLIVSEL